MQWQHLVASLPEDLPLADLKTIICPLIAKDEVTQQRIYEVFDQTLEQVEAVNIPILRTDDAEKKAHYLKWWIAGFAGLLVLISVIPILDGYQHLGIIQPTYSTLTPNETVTICIDKERLEYTPTFKNASLCDGAQNGNSAFGTYRIKGLCLEYTSKDSLGQDSICVALRSKWLGRTYHTAFLPSIEQTKVDLLLEEQDTIVAKDNLRFEYKAYPFKNDIRSLEIRPLNTWEAFYQKYAIPLKLLFSLLSALLLWAILHYRQQKRQKLIAELDSSHQPPYVWNIQIEGIDDIQVSETFHKTLHLLKQRVGAENYHFDIAKTIQASIKKGGMMDFQYSQITRPPEYLLLIDRQSNANHRAQLFNWLCKQFKAQEVLVERFYYDGDIRLCTNENYPDGLNLKELQHKFYNARLLILGTGTSLLSAMTGKLAKWTNVFEGWSQRSLLNPKPTSQWGRRERSLSSLFALVPASMQGIHYLVDQLDAGEAIEQQLWAEKIKDAVEKPIEITGNLIESLSQHYDERQLKWIAACAVYPSLHWDLSLFLGKLLENDDAITEKLLSVDNIQAINRLSWFIEGEMPKAVRLQLLKWLENEHPKFLNNTRQALHHLLQQNHPPKDSAAWEEYSMNLALNEWLISKNSKRKKELERQIAADLDRGIEADFTILKYLDRPQIALDFIVPDRWKKYLHKGGHKALGLKDFWKDVFYWALPFWLFACAFAWWMPTEWGACEGEIHTYQDDNKELSLCITRPQTRILLHEYLAKQAIASDKLNEQAVNSRTQLSSSRNTVLEILPDSIDRNRIWKQTDSLTAVVQQILDLGIDPIKNEEEVNEYIRLDSAGLAYFRNIAVAFYNKGIDFYQQIDKVADEALKNELKIMACIYFERANIYNLQDVRSMEGPIPDTVRNIRAWRQNSRHALFSIDADVSEAATWCNAANLPENIPMRGVIYEEGGSKPIENVKVTFQNQIDFTDNYGRYVFQVRRSNIKRTVALKIEKLGYETIAQDFSVAKNDSSILVLGLTRLRVRSNNTGAQPPDETPKIYTLSGRISNKKTGGTPLGKILIASQQARTNMKSDGTYELKIPATELRNNTARIMFTAVGYQDVVQQVNFSSSESLNLDIELERIQPIRDRIDSTEIKENLAWTTAQRNNNSIAYNVYLKKYPNGKYATEAKAKLGQLNQIFNPQQQQTAAIPETGTFIDNRDQQRYKWVRLKDGKRWMAENLNFKMEDSWCYEENSKNCAQYGRLYPWAAALKACPNGWRLPSDDEWWEMAEFYGEAANVERGQYRNSENSAGKAVYQALLQGEDSAFSVLFGGLRLPDGTYNDFGKSGTYWSSTKKGASDAFLYSFAHNSLIRSFDSKSYGFSCRCIQD